MRLIVIGCGSVGAGLTQSLDQRGHNITVVDSDPDAFLQLGASFHGQKIVGIGFDRDVLLQAGIERTDGLAAVTSSDETNIVAAQVARQIFHVPQVVARVNHPRQATIYHRLGLQTIAPTIWGINRIADILCHSHLDILLTLGNGDVDIVQMEIPPAIAGKLVRDITVLNEISVVSITRSGKTFLPTLGAMFEVGDQIQVALINTATDRLNDLLELR